MVDFLVRFTDGKSECFMEWSTISDGPNTPPMSESEIRDFVKAEYGRKGAETIDARIARCRHRGHSLKGDESRGSLECALCCNRAGKDETRMTIAQMVDFYLHRGGNGEPPEGDWPDVRGHDYDPDDPEAGISPDSREWMCPIHGVHHDDPFCEPCMVKARERCEGDR